MSFGAVVLSSVALSGSVQADAAGDKFLSAMETSMNAYKTMAIEYEAIDQAPGKAERKLALAVKIKGDKRVTEFLAPADMKGTKVLILSATQMYVYLPAFGKVRRIASHMTDQGFMGMTYSQDDFMTRYAAQYTPQIASDSATETKLVLTAKGADAPYGKLEMTVAKDKYQVKEIKYFNATGTHTKTETRTGYTCEAGACVPSEQTMVDHTKGGHSTKLIRAKWKVNPDISDDAFSKRSLEK
jgi:outer membrane lipoprotein-sorting protein